VIINCLF